MAEMNSRLVYSTDRGSLCPECGQVKMECACHKRKRNKAPEPSGKIAIRYETAGRKGKGVTVIMGLALAPAQLDELARKLKARLGTGGTVRDFTIELQGDHRAQVPTHLAALGVKT